MFEERIKKLVSGEYVREEVHEGGEVLLRYVP